MAHTFTWHDLLRFSHGWIYVLKWPLSFVAGWIAIYFRRWKKSRNETSAQGWPSVEGRVTGGTVKPVPKTSRFHVTLDYVYFLDEYRSGQYTHDFPNQDDADTLVRQMKDQRVQIRYKQSDPNVSVLEQRTLEQYVMLAPRIG